MKRLVNTKDMPVTTWLNYRRMGVCGSDTGIILGLNSYRSVIELWHDKTGQIPIEEADNNFTHFGHLLEPIIRKEFQRQTGWKVSVRNAIFQSEENPFMLADIDGIVTEEDGSKAVFEAKTAIEYKKENWEDGKIPDAYYSQLQHYMYVLGLDKAYIACLVGGNSFYYYKINRDDAYILTLIEKEKTFWNHVRDLTMPEVDSSSATTAYLGKLYENTVSDEIMLPDEAGDIVQAYLRVDEKIKNLNKEKDLLGNQLKVMLNQHEVGHAGDFRVSWKAYTRTSIDTKLLKEKLGESISEYTTESRYRRLSVA